MHMKTMFARMSRGGLSLCIVIAGLLWIGNMERTLWRQAPPEALDRYAVDRLLPPLPAKVQETDLWALCADRPWLSYLWNTRDALAGCLDLGAVKPSATALQLERIDALARTWTRAIQDQIAVANEVAAITPEAALPTFVALRSLHQRLQTESGGPLLRFLERHGAPLPEPLFPRTVTAPSAEDSLFVARYFAKSQRYTKARLAEIAEGERHAQTAEERWVAARNLGLLATGLSLDHRNAMVIPQPKLKTDPDSLADQMEWARRAHPRAGKPLERTLTGFMAMMTVSSLIVVAIAAMLNTYPVMAGLLCLLATLGGEQLIDIAVTGSWQLKHVPTRDFAEGIWNLWNATVHIGGLDFNLWGTALIFVIALAVGVLVANVSWVARATEHIVRMPLGWQASLLTVGTLGMVAVPGMSAFKTEMISLLAVSLPLAIFMARYAPQLKFGASTWGLAVYAAPLLVAAVFSSATGNILRGDLGALGVSILTALAFLVLVVSEWHTRLIIVGVLTMVSLYYCDYLFSGRDPAHLIAVLSEHVKQRFLLLLNAAHHGAPDLKQVEWLIHKASQAGSQGAGFSPGNVPWTGLPGSNKTFALPLPAISDLAFVLPAAIGGFAYALGIVAAVAAVLVIIIWRGYERAVGNQVRVGERFIAALGAFGLLVSLMRLMLSIGGTLQVIPLTGVPIVFLSHAPVATAMAMAFAGLVLGVCRPRKN